MRKVIKNAQVVLENGIMWDGAILIEDDKIAKICKEKDMVFSTDIEEIDAEGSYVGPGFVDIHVHEGGGFSTSWNPVEAAEFFLRHGETSILASPYYRFNTEELVAAMCSVKEGMMKTKVIKGIYSEGPYMNPDYGAGASKNPWRHGVVEQEFKRFVDEGGQYVKVWAIAPEMEHIVEFMEYARKVNPNVKFAIGHSEATPDEIRKIKKYKPTIQTHSMNATGRRDECRGVRAVGPDEYCFQDNNIYCELISDSCAMHVKPDMQRLLIHNKGIDKVILITDSTVRNNPVPEEFCRAKDLNFNEQGALSGSKITMDQACQNIMQSTNCGIAQAFLMASTNPAKAIDMDDVIGSIEVGKKADLVFVDDKFHVKKVMLEGEIVVNN